MNGCLASRDDWACEDSIHLLQEGTRSVKRIAGLAVVVALDDAIGPVKQRDRGLTGGQLLVSLAQTQMLGGDFLACLDRRRDDIAGEALSAVPTPPSTTAAGLAARFGPAQLAGVEEGIGELSCRAVALAPVKRRTALRTGMATIDLDGTDVEVYGSHKDGVSYNYKGQRAGRPHVATWAEAGLVVAADLLAGDEDPRPGAGGLIERSVATLRAAGVSARPRVRGDVGYFAADIAWAAVTNGCGFSLGVTRNKAAWRAAAAIPSDEWTPAIGMKGAQVAVACYTPAGWPPDTACVVRRVRIRAEDISTDPRARKRRTIPKDQLALALDGLVDEVYGYSFIATNIDVSTPAKAAALEAWHRMRTDIEDRIRDAKHGAALRHLPSSSRAVSRVAATHCCAAAPSEPCMRLINAHGSSKSLGRCGLKCWLPTLAGLYPASAGGVYQAGSSVVRRADPVLVDEVLDGYRLAGDAQPPAFPVAWRLRRLVLGEQVVPTQWAATALLGEQAKVVAVQWGFDPSPSGSPVVGLVGVVGGRRACDHLMADDVGPGELHEVGNVPALIDAGAVAENPPVAPGLAEPAEVASHDPRLRLVGVGVLGPFVGEFPHVVVQRVEDSARHHPPVVGGPTPDDRVEPGDDRRRVRAAQGARLGREPFPESLDGRSTRLDQQLAVSVAANVDPQEVEPLGEVHDLRLVLVEGKTTGGQPLGELGLDLLGLPLGVTAHNKIISVPDQDRGFRFRLAGIPAGGLVPDPCGLLQPMECDVHQQRADHAALRGSLLGRCERR